LRTVAEMRDQLTLEAAILGALGVQSNNQIFRGGFDSGLEVRPSAATWGVDDEVDEDQTDLL
jgi:hypothetical protein